MVSGSPERASWQQNADDDPCSAVQPVGRNRDRWPRAGLVSLGSALAASSSTRALHCPCVSQIRVLRDDDGGSAEPFASSCRQVHGQGDARIDHKLEGCVACSESAAIVFCGRASPVSALINLGENPVPCGVDRGCWHAKSQSPTWGQGHLQGPRQGQTTGVIVLALLHRLGDRLLNSRPLNSESALRCRHTTKDYLVKEGTQ